MRDGIKTYVHCKAGRGRSVSIVLCYKILNHCINHGDVSIDDMLKMYEELKVMRPEIGLNEQQLSPIREYLCSLSSNYVV